MIERNDNMVDIADRPIFVGDVISIPSSYRSGASLYIIKHFSKCGIFGWRMTPYYWESGSIEKRIDNYIKTGSLHLSTRYASRMWGSNHGFNNRVTKVEIDSLDIPKGKYYQILNLMGVQNEFEPTGSLRL